MNTTLANHENRNANRNSLIERIFDDLWIAPTGSATQSWHPVCEVIESDDHYLLNMEVAGIPKDQINIEIQDRQLLISGERKIQSQGAENGVVYSERRFGKFERGFTLPPGLNTEKIQANYQDGILRVMVPKVESAKPRTIKIGE